MATKFPLAAVLALRQRKEEQEERALAAIAAERQQVLATLDRIENELRQWSEMRSREVGGLHHGALQQAMYARHKLLCEAKERMLEQLRSTEGRWQQQQGVYLAARSGREMLTELKQRLEQARAAEQVCREQRRSEDMFLARRAR